MARLIKESARGPVKIHGFTDALGKADYNQKLSERRANSVKAWLTSHGGVAGRNISTLGFGHATRLHKTDIRTVRMIQREGSEIGECR